MQDKAPEDVEYRETVGLGAWLHAMILLLVLLYAVVMAGLLAVKNITLLIIFGVTELFIVAMYVNFRQVTFEITRTQVRFGFGPFMKRFTRASVLSCEPYELTFANYLGYGIRWGRDGTVAYNTRNGPGVKITVEGEKRPYVVAIDNPEKVCGILSAGVPDA